MHRWYVSKAAARFVPLMVLVGLLVFQTAALGEPPLRINYQGRLTDDQNQPQVGSRLMYFSLFRGGTADGAIPGVALYRESSIVELDGSGVFEHAIGSGSTISGSLTPATFNTTSPVTFRWRAAIRRTFSCRERK